MQSEILKDLLKKRIYDLEKDKSKARGQPHLWWSIGQIDDLLKLNKKLYFDLFGIYEMRLKQ